MLENAIGHLSIGVKDVLGSRADSFYFYHRMGKFSDRHIKPYLTKDKRNVYPYKTEDSSSNSITVSSCKVCNDQSVKYHLGFVNHRSKTN